MGATMGKSGGHFLDALPSQGTLHVVMLGLDSAGKTTALYRLKFDQYLNTVPTIGFNCEKVQGTVGKAKGVQFLVWDVGGQEKLRPLWRSYTRCTDGILFVVDSVDVERMEEAKMELMRTARCPDNHGVPVLILANKQDLPGACDPKELEKLLGLQELLHPSASLKSISSSSSTNIVACNSNSSNSSYRSTSNTSGSSSMASTSFGSNVITNSSSVNTELNMQNPVSVNKLFDLKSVPESSSNTLQMVTKNSSTGSVSGNLFKGWYIQPACAITGEGLQEGLEALYEMILKRRKLNRAFKRKR